MQDTRRAGDGKAESDGKAVSTQEITGNRNQKEEKQFSLTHLLQDGPPLPPFLLPPSSLDHAFDCNHNPSLSPRVPRSLRLITCEKMRDKFHRSKRNIARSYVLGTLIQMT